MLVSCAQCGKEFDKLPSQIKKTNNSFCSQSCAATFNNVKYPKRHKIEKIKLITTFNKLVCLCCGASFVPRRANQKYCNTLCANQAAVARFRSKNLLTNKCKICGAFISKFASSGHCKLCFDALRISELEKRTLEELKLEGARSNTYTRVRDSLKNKFQRFVPNNYHKCFVCGENEVYELCHIKPVSSFSDDALLKDISSFNNIVILCPTHHWKYDHANKCTIDRDSIPSLAKWLEQDKIDLGIIYNKLFI